jgi:hypothetical protein
LGIQVLKVLNGIKRAKSVIYSCVSRQNRTAQQGLSAHLQAWDGLQKQTGVARFNAAPLCFCVLRTFCVGWIVNHSLHGVGLTRCKLQKLDIVFRFQIVLRALLCGCIGVTEVE